MVAYEATVLAAPEQSLIFQALATADVVYLGEQHDNAADHAAQLAIIQALQAEHGKLAIALEMFQRPFQPALDRYLAGEITETELIEQTDYETRWGFPWEYYAPILRFAKEHNLPLLALNAPAEITQQVAREGLDSLSGDDFRYIPDRQEIDLSNTDYRDFVATALGSHGAHGNFNLDNFFAAQVVWDETMAATLATFRQANPQIPIIVLAGQGHVAYGYGIPDRLNRRLGSELVQQIVLLNPSTNLAGDADSADVVWLNE
jgi:uncharacterized iron-regulated protein